jgi:hypothetical protein
MSSAQGPVTAFEQCEEILHPNPQESIRCQLRKGHAGEHEVSYEWSTEKTKDFGDVCSRTTFRWGV